MARKRTFSCRTNIQCTCRKSQKGQILPTQVANQNAGFPSPCTRSQIQPYNTVKPPLTATSTQRPSLYTCDNQFFGGQSIHRLLFKPLYNGHLSTMATLLCSQGGCCGEVQL